LIRKGKEDITREEQEFNKGEELGNVWGKKI
jgi:hypothetical protein